MFDCIESLFDEMLDTILDFIDDVVNVINEDDVE